MAAYLVDRFIDRLKDMAHDDTYTYGRWSSPQGNGLGNIEDPKSFDCCTSISYCIYKAMGWKWAKQIYGYYWPHVQETGFDAFLTDMLHLDKLMWSDADRQYLQPGDILISDADYNHTVCYIGDNLIFDANDYYKDSIAIRSYYDMHWLYCYRWKEESEDPMNVLKTLKKGSTGNQVKNLQALLNLWMSKSEPLLIDGIFGEVTESRLKRYQELQGLNVDGIAGDETWSDILS